MKHLYFQGSNDSLVGSRFGGPPLLDDDEVSRLRTAEENLLKALKF